MWCLLGDSKERAMGKATWWLVATFAATSWMACDAYDEPAPPTPQAESALATESGAVAVSGPWVIPPWVNAAQHVPVINPPSVAPLGSCSSSNAFQCSCTHPECSPAHDGTVDLDQYIRNKWNYLTSGGLYCCRQNSAQTSVPKLSVHAVGRAIDLMVPMVGGQANNSLGDPVANWLVDNAQNIGIQRVIWDRAYWNGNHGYGHLSSSSLPHTDHIHVELSIEGAAKLTQFFTSGAYLGACEPRCEDNTIIYADCTSGDCGAFGVECLPGPPPVCGEPPPPEPPAAVAVPNAGTPSFASVGTPSRVSFVDAQRIFDTRTPSLSTNLTRGTGGTTGPLSATGVNVYTPPAGMLPSNTRGLWLNLAALPLTAQGFAVVGPAGQGQPPTSSINFVPGQNVANAVPAIQGTGGGVAFHASTNVNAVADLTAVFRSSGNGLTTTPPTRVFDTREASAPLQPNVVRAFDVEAPPGATGVVGTLTVLGASAPGFLAAFPCGSPTTGVSNINYPADTVRANALMVELGTNQELCLRSLEEVNAIFDVTGYLSPAGPLSYQPVTPKRLLDTRSDTSLFKNRLAAQQNIELPIQGLSGMPNSVWSVVANVAVVGATSPGFVTLHPCSDPVPHTSSLNFAELPVAALSMSSVSGAGTLCAFASSRAHLIIDVVGVWVHDLSALPTPFVTDEHYSDQGEPFTPTDDPNPDPEPDVIGGDTTEADTFEPEADTFEPEADTAVVDAATDDTRIEDSVELDTAAASDTGPAVDTSGPGGVDTSSADTVAPIDTSTADTGASDDATAADTDSGTSVKGGSDCSSGQAPHVGWVLLAALVWVRRRRLGSALRSATA